MIEVRITRYNREAMMPRNRSDPNIVLGEWLACLLKLALDAAGFPSYFNAATQDRSTRRKFVDSSNVFRDSLRLSCAKVEFA